MMLNVNGYAYRPLKVGLSGWDVYALQSTFVGLDKDSYFGPVTEAAVKNFQLVSKLTVDGIAGVVTQRALTLRDVWPVQTKYDTPPGLIRGQLEHESSFWIGNNSIRYPNGSFDMGVAQINSQPIDTSMKINFNVPAAIELLGLRLRTKFDLYYGDEEVPRQRAWELASGSWNAPAWTDTLARGGTLSASQEVIIDAYIDATTTYVVDWS